MNKTKNETSPALQVLADITKIPAEFLLKEDAVMLNVPSVLKAMEEFAEASVNKLTNMIEVEESLDNSIPAAEDNLKPVKGEFVWIDKQKLRVGFVERGDGRWVIARQLTQNESLDNSIPAPAEELAPERNADDFLRNECQNTCIWNPQKTGKIGVIGTYVEVMNAMVAYGKQCFEAGERARDHYYNDRNSDVTRKKIGYLFFEDYIIHLKSKK